MFCWWDTGKIICVTNIVIMFLRIKYSTNPNSKIWITYGSRGLVLPYTVPWWILSSLLHLQCSLVIMLMSISSHWAPIFLSLLIGMKDRESLLTPLCQAPELPVVRGNTKEQTGRTDDLGRRVERVHTGVLTRLNAFIWLFCRCTEVAHELSDN